jgi:hypothetical protein
MMNETPISFGHGYENPGPNSRYRPCTTFAGYDILAEPLGGFSNADRERRVFGRNERGHGGVTYGSHAVKLGRSQGSSAYARKTLAVMMHHGGGREVTQLRICQQQDEIEAALTGMPEAALYFLLYAINEASVNAYRQGIRETDAKWRTALEEGRVKKRRPKAGVRRGGWDILQPYEMELKSA